MPTTVTSLGGWAFWWNTNLLSVVLPGGLTNIGIEAFGGCTSLTNVTIPKSLISVGDSAFWACTQLVGIVLPNGVTSLGANAFFGCSSLQNITIPNSVLALGDEVFGECTSLKSVSLQNNALGSGEFSGCTTLASITIPEGITTIPDGAFESTGLTNLIIPSNISRIGDFGFSGCNSPTNVIIPESVNYIGGAAFAGCTALGSVRIPESVTSIGNGYIGKGVAGTFSGCTNLTNVVLGKSLSSIGSAAFFDCSSLRSMIIPKSVRSIGEFCFGYSPNLTALYFEGDAPLMDAGAFVVLSETDPTTLYYLPGTQGWGPSFASRPTAWWVLPNPVILNTGPAIGPHSDGFGLAVSWGSNSIVVLEGCTSLLNPTWLTLDSKPLANGTLEFRDLQWTNHPHVSTAFARLDMLSGWTDLNKGHNLPYKPVGSQNN